MKFKAGDKFFVLENGLEGEIIKIIYNSIYQQDEYLVKWNHHAKEESYPVDECDPLWEHSSIIQNMLDSHHHTFQPWHTPVLEHIELKFTIDDKGIKFDPCHHNWKTYDSGFRRFQYCEHCNEEQHEN